MSEMEEAYAEAWREWEVGDDAQLWETTVADGIGVETPQASGLRQLDGALSTHLDR